MSIAKKLIDDSKKAGVNAVKFKKERLTKFILRRFLTNPGSHHGEQLRENKKKVLNFSLEDYKQIDAYCKELKIDWYASAWDEESQDFPL